MRLTTAIIAALVSKACAVDVLQSDDKLINYVDNIEECELSCWRGKTKELGCGVTEFGCVCKNAGSIYIGKATMCAFQACDNAFALQFDMGALCGYYESMQPNGTEVEDAQNRLKERLSNITDAGGNKPATPTNSGGSATKSSSPKGNGESSAAGAVGVSAGFLGTAALLAAFLYKNAGNYELALQGTWDGGPPLKAAFSDWLDSVVAREDKQAVHVPHPPFQRSRCSDSMPFVGGDLPPPARKRRWLDHDDDNDRSRFTLYRADDSVPIQRCAFGSDHSFGNSARKMAVPISKRTRFDEDSEDNHVHNGTDLTPSHRRRISQQSQKQKIQHNIFASTQHRVTKNAAAPCHICHRRPTKKSDLDSFAQCEGCNEQTCFVCIRQCYGRGDMSSVLSEQEALSRSFHMEDADATASTKDSHDLDGWSPTQLQQDRPKQTNTSTQNWAACGHRSVVCSGCCVEKGPEGEVVCLGCLFGDESPETMTF
ncbi:hypothetical protein NLG97_g2653 [Lecanicillium saksenae]|uniref:Uncharacterized protein n=1 Tax=Lecanicillium saksenae TaxID=468837 RepID=A0ACC1R3K8_9HYPO|nr:hypothetical protein NLG97_g2653 [Lecanicillium saksenae]